MFWVLLVQSELSPSVCLALLTLVPPRWKWPWEQRKIYPFKNVDALKIHLTQTLMHSWVLGAESGKR